MHEHKWIKQGYMDTTEGGRMAIFKCECGKMSTACGCPNCEKME